jgi:Flp pilus assembly protein TadG
MVCIIRIKIELDSRRKLSAGGLMSRGQSSAEFALTAVVFLMLVFGTIDLSRALYAYDLVCDAAKTAIRYASLNGSGSANPAKSSDIQNLVMQLCDGLDAVSQCPANTADDLCATTTWTPDNNPGSIVKVQVRYAFAPLTPFIPSSTLTLSSTAQLVIVH